MEEEEEEDDESIWKIVRSCNVSAIDRTLHPYYDVMHRRNINLN